MKNKPKIVVIVGQTASGKTSLSIKIAKKFGGLSRAKSRGEIVSADSRQVYKGLDIGSGKVTQEEMDGIPHHLLDVADPKETYTAAEYARDGRKAVAGILSRGNLPIVVGGTFFYIDALLGRIQTPEVPPNPEFRKKLEQKTTGELYADLETKDPRRAADIDEHNKVRLVRALEIVDALGFVPHTTSEEIYSVLTIGVGINKEDLHKNIHRRLLARIEDGMVEEVERLHGDGLLWERLEGFGLEYRYVAQFLQQKISKEEMLTVLESEIRKYAKRQMTWLKRDKTIHWFGKDQKDEIFRAIERFLSS